MFPYLLCQMLLKYKLLFKGWTYQDYYIVLPLFFYQLNQILLYYNPFQNLKKALSLLVLEITALKEEDMPMT